MPRNLSLLLDRTVADYISLSAIIPLLFATRFVMEGDPHWALLLAIGAFVLDTLDGWVARKYGMESDFGRQLDSSVDILVYLVFPSLFVMRFMDHSWTAVPTLAFTVGCGILRLVRFNSRGFVLKDGLRHYPGLGVAYVLLTVVVAFILEHFLGGWVRKILPVVLVMLSVLMVSERPFRKPSLAFWYPFTLLIAATLLLIKLHLV